MRRSYLLRATVVATVASFATPALLSPSAYAGDGGTMFSVTKVAQNAPFAKPGPYVAGVTTIKLDDRSIEVWYPANKSSAKGKKKDSYYLRDWLPTAIQDLLDAKGVNPPFKTDAYRALPVAKGAFPLLVFSHGAGGYRDQSTFLTTHLATWGFVVASPDFLERGIASQLGGAPTTPKANLEVYDETVAKIREVNAASKGLLHGHIKTKKIGVLGHSAGARGSIEIAASRDDVIAYAPLAGAGSGGTRGTVTIPAIIPPSKPNIFIAGNQDGVIPIAGIQTYFDDVVAPKRGVWVEGSGHLTAFSDICEIGKGGGGIVAIAREAGLPVPENLARLGEDGCKPPALKASTTWPVTRHFTTALFLYAFKINKKPIGLNVKAAEAFAPKVTATYTQTLK